MGYPFQIFRKCRKCHRNNGLWSSMINRIHLLLTHVVSITFYNYIGIYRNRNVFHKYRVKSKSPINCMCIYIYKVIIQISMYIYMICTYHIYNKSIWGAHGHRDLYGAFHLERDFSDGGMWWGIYPLVI